MKTTIKHLIKSKANPVALAVNYLNYSGRHRSILARQNTFIRGKRRIQGSFRIGTKYMGLVRNPETFINIESGSMEGHAYIGSGCKINCCGGKLELNGCTVNVNNQIICADNIYIGINTLISWDCLIMDTNFHEFNGDNNSEPVHISSDVWIGARVTILKGTFIAPGCVVAAGSVVKGQFIEESCLIAGNPAKVVKTGILWK